jgi:putative transcriptional regulator
MDDELFSDLMEGMREAVAYQKGKASTATRAHTVEVEHIDVKALRQRLGMTQEGFASTFAFKVNTVAQWEQRRRSPRGPERVLLKVIQAEPEAVRRALGG